MAISRTDRSSFAGQPTRSEPKPAEPRKVEPPKAIDTSVSTFKAPTRTPLSLTSPAASRAAADADVTEYRQNQAVSQELAETRLAEKIGARKDDPLYCADVAGQLGPYDLSRLYSAAKVEDKGAIAGAIKAGISQSLISERDVKRAASLSAREGTGLAEALAGADPVAMAETQAAATALDTAKTALSIAEARFVEHVSVGDGLVTNEQRAAATAAFREQNAKLYEDVSKAEDALRASLEANEGKLSESTLVDGYTRLAGTKHAEAALDWAAERARTEGPSEALEGIVAAALPTAAATATAKGTAPESFRAQLEAKLAPFMDPAAVEGAVETAWDFKDKAETIQGALESFTALANGTAKPDDIAKLGKEWAEQSTLGKAIAIGGLAYDLYGAATADSAKETIDSLLSATEDAATILGGLAQSGRLGAEALGVSSEAIGKYAGRFVPALGVVTSLASAYSRYQTDGVTLGSTVSIAGDLVSAAGSAISATGLGTLPGEVITSVGTGISLAGEGISAVVNDATNQAEREAIWRAANEKLPPEKRIGEETMGYLRGGISNSQTWADGGTSTLPRLPPELLQRAIESGHLGDLERLEEDLRAQVQEELVPKGLLPFESFNYVGEHADELGAEIQKRFEEQAPALLEELLAGG